VDFAKGKIHRRKAKNLFPQKPKFCEFRRAIKDRPYSGK
jgi:hypothetical protein